MLKIIFCLLFITTVSSAFILDFLGSLKFESPQKFENRILNGSSDYNKSNDPICTASLISDLWAITAFHCIENNVDGKVMYGTVDRNSQDAQFLEFAETHLYKQHDVALIKLQNSTGIKSFISLSKSFKSDEEIIGAGWGWQFVKIKKEFQDQWVDLYDTHSVIKYLDIVWPSVAQFDSFPLNENQICLDSKGLNFDPKTNICVGKSLHSSSQGDSGGPLIVKRNEKLYQIGVCSRGVTTILNGELEGKGVYTKVAVLCDKIKEITDGAVSCQD